MNDFATSVNEPISKAMILAAGLGTRLKPWTDHHPKALAIVNGKSLLQRNVEYLQHHGIKDVIINVHHFADQVIRAIEHNNGWGSNLSISDEQAEVLETGGGLKKAAPYFKGSKNFILMNVDVLTDLPLTSMIDYHLRNKPLATLATTSRKTSRYFLFNETNQLSGWTNVEKVETKISRPAAHYEKRAFSGIHIINSHMLSLIHQQGKFSMVDVYLALSSTENILSFDHSQSHFIDVGKPESIAKAEALFK